MQSMVLAVLLVVFEICLCCPTGVGGFNLLLVFCGVSLTIGSTNGLSIWFVANFSPRLYI